MLEAKTFELRDRMTFIPIVAVSCKVNAGDRIERYKADEYLLRRAGYEPSNHRVIITRLEGGPKAYSDYYYWGDRTLTVAHKFIAENWDSLVSGEVIDVEFILGETTQKKESEATYA